MTGVFQGRPGPSDDDIEFDSDMAYLRDLAEAIFTTPPPPRTVLHRWIDAITYLQAEVIRAVNK